MLFEFVRWRLKTRLHACMHEDDIRVSSFKRRSFPHVWRACKCDVSSQSIIGWLSLRQLCPTSPCSCIWGPIKQCLARWSHDPWGNKSLPHDLDFSALSAIVKSRVWNVTKFLTPLKHLFLFSYSFKIHFVWHVTVTVIYVNLWLIFISEIKVSKLLAFASLKLPTKQTTPKHGFHPSCSSAIV